MVAQLRGSAVSVPGPGVAAGRGLAWVVQPPALTPVEAASGLPEGELPVTDLQALVAKGHSVSLGWSSPGRCWGSRADTSRAPAGFEFRAGLCRWSMLGLILKRSEARTGGEASPALGVLAEETLGMIRTPFCPTDVPHIQKRELKPPNRLGLMLGRAFRRPTGREQPVV